MWETFLLSSCAGCRTMTPIAVMCWFAYLGLLSATGWTSWSATLPAVIVFTLCALGEYVADVLPQTPSRKKLSLIAARLVFGLLAASLLWHAMGQPPAGGLVLGLLGVFAGVFGGYRLRMSMAQRFGRDLPAGLLESASVLALSIFAAWHVHYGLQHIYVMLLQHSRVVAS